MESWDSRTKYETLVASIDEGFCVIEVVFDAHDHPVDYIFVETNPSFERQTGLVNAVGGSMRSFAPTHEEHWFEIYGRIALSGESERFEAQAEALGRWYDVYAFRVGKPRQRLVAILFQDITRRKELERSLESRNAALHEADLRKDRFLATLSHELRNPLAPLRFAAELLGRPGVAEPQLARAREIIGRQVAQMGRLLDDLLDIGRITQGKVALRRQVVAPAEVIENAVETVRPLIKRKRHELTVEIDPYAPVLDVDPVRISQVVANLLTNAAKYTDPGGRISLHAHANEGSFIVSVSDNGIGLPPEALSDVFEMFMQREEAAERSEGGLGIGLTLVKALVELHGGTVRAESEGSGKGSRFTVCLPVASLAGDAARMTAPPGTMPKPRRILVADDNRDAADTIAMLLESFGHEVQVAYDGRTALALGRKLRPDFALLDIGMPGMSGYDVARSLRSERPPDALMLVAITGWGDLTARELAREAGFDRHLTKPVPPEDLQALLRSPLPTSGTASSPKGP